jgi:hypothetical protein
MTYAATGVVTREELEDTLRREGFTQQGTVWWSQDRTKFVSFPDDTSGEAIYGDAEIGEPGKTIPLAHALRVVRGELLLDSPLGVQPVQTREPAQLGAPARRALPGQTADDALPALPPPTSKDCDNAVWFVRPLRAERETIRPPGFVRSGTRPLDRNATWINRLARLVVVASVCEVLVTFVAITAIPGSFSKQLAHVALAVIPMMVLFACIWMTIRSRKP